MHAFIMKESLSINESWEKGFVEEIEYIFTKAAMKFCQSGSVDERRDDMNRLPMMFLSFPAESGFKELDSEYLVKLFSTLVFQFCANKLFDTALHLKNKSDLEKRKKLQGKIIEEYDGLSQRQTVALHQAANHINDAKQKKRENSAIGGKEKARLQRESAKNDLSPFFNDYMKENDKPSKHGFYMYCVPHKTGYGRGALYNAYTDLQAAP